MLALASQMDGDQHRCKVCMKCFPCGRSLGGHMRSHATTVAESDEPPRQDNHHRSSAVAGAGYGLRENPKKTVRRVFYLAGSPTRKCKECSKEFPSWRALFGHMRWHSERVHRSSKPVVEQDQEQGQEEQVGRAMVPKRKRGSRRAPAPCLPAFENEIEHAAIALMMLSRDTRFWVGLHSVVESSDNNSVVEGGDWDFGSDGFEAGKAKKLEMGRKESDLSVQFVKDCELKKSKLEYSDEESMQGSSKKRNLNCNLAELGKKTRLDQSGSHVGKLTSSKKDKFDAYDARFGGDYTARFGFGAPDGDFNARRYECTTCNKAFHSYQALGGHRACHKRFDGGHKASFDCGEDSRETDASVEQIAAGDMIEQSGGTTEASYGSLKKIKDYECNVCGKVFPSGQALGGHKRSHKAASDDASQQNIVIEQKPSVMPDLFDLNLPAPVDGGSTSNNGILGCGLMVVAGMISI